MILKIIITILSVFNFVISGKLSKSILHPIRIFSLMWAFFSIIPLWLWDVNYVWQYKGVIWINLAVSMTIIGAMLAGNTVFTQDCIRWQRKESGQRKVCFYLVLAVGFFCVFYSLLSQGYSIRDIVSIEGLARVSGQNAALRYSETATTSTLVQILNVFVYASGLCGGYSFNFSSKRLDKIIAVMGVAPMLLEMLITSGKSGFIAVMILWAAGWTVSYVQIYGKLPVLTKKVMAILIVLFLAFLCLLYFAMLLRVSDFSGPTRKLILNKFFIYAFGHMVEFDAWFDGQDEFTDYAIGQNTYMMLFRLLGTTERINGVYDVYIQEYGNIFTAFRGVIADFGVLGGLIYCFARGAVTQTCYNTVVTQKAKCLVTPILLASSYFWMMYGFIVSPWIYTIYVLMMVVFGAFLIFYNKLDVRFKKFSLNKRLECANEFEENR